MFESVMAASEQGDSREEWGVVTGTSSGGRGSTQ